MSSWLFYALFSPLIFAVVNLTDKFLLGRRLTPFAFSIFAGLVWFWVLLLVPFIGLPISSWSLALAGFLAGVFSLGSTYPYFRALAIEEASRITPLWALSSIMILATAALFLGERLYAPDYVGFGLIVFGAFLISTRHVGRVLKPRKAFWLMVLATSINAASWILAKWVYDSGLQFWHGQVLFGSGFAFASLVLLLFSGKTKKFLRELTGLKRGLALLAAREVILVAGVVMSYFAILLGPVSLTSALLDLNSTYTFLLATALSFWLPGIIKEQVDKKTLLTKGLAISSIIAGVFAMNL